MPAEAVGLDLHVEGIDTGRIAEIQNVVTAVGFQPDPHEEGMVGGVVNYQPFEYTDENMELVEECVEQLSDELPGLNVSYEIRTNRDRGKVLAKICRIHIDSGR